MCVCVCVRACPSLLPLAGCQQPSCVSCPESYLVCSECNPGVLVNGICYTSASAIVDSSSRQVAIVISVVLGVVAIALVAFAIAWRRQRRMAAQLSHHLLDTQAESELKIERSCDVL
jgi:hypothetical protein